MADLSEQDELELLSLERERAKRGPSMTAVVKNAAYKGVAGLPDMLLNAPNEVMNLGKAAFGTAATAAGRPDLAPGITPNPDLARRGMEAVGLINPQVVPQGPVQQGVDAVTQGAVGGALTGGASIPRTAAGAALGGLSAGSQAAVQGVTGNDAAGIAAGLAVPAMAARVGGGGVKLTPQQQLLKDEGVVMTPGQIKGGALKRAEDAATSIPVLGDAIKSAQRRGIESFDAAAINRSLEPIGAKLPAGLKGNKAVEYAHGKLGDAYDNLLPRLKGDLDATMQQDIATIKQMGQNLPEPQRGQLQRIIDREVTARFTAQGKASGETLKEIESKLGGIEKRMRVSDDYDVRTLGTAIEETQNALRRMVERVNPQAQGELAKINEGYANFKRVQNAAGRVGAAEGVFTPAQLHSAVRAGDTSKDKARFSEGNALMQDLSAAGKSNLSPVVPDSGTPIRGALMYALAHPLKATALGIPIGLGTLPYTSVGQQALQSWMTSPNNLSNVASRVSAPVTLMELLQQQQK